MSQGRNYESIKGKDKEKMESYDRADSDVYARLLVGFAVKAHFTTKAADARTYTIYDSAVKF